MPEPDPRDLVRRAKTSLAERLKNVAGITSLGIGKAAGSGDYIVRVTVRDRKAAEQVPADCEGVAVEVSVSGDFEAQ